MPLFISFEATISAECVSYVSVFSTDICFPFGKNFIGQRNNTTRTSLKFTVFDDYFQYLSYYFFVS